MAVALAWAARRSPHRARALSVSRDLLGSRR
jgi:hypothetical protein